MLTPEQLANIPENIVALYEQLESFIIRDFARRVSKTGEITDTAEWIRERAKMFGINNIESEVLKTLKLSLEQVEELFPEVANVSVEHENAIYKKAELDTVTIKGNKELEGYLEAAIRQTKGELENITGSLGFAVKENGVIKYKPIAKFYQDTLNFAQLKISSGVQDYNTAVRQAVKQMTDSGLRFVDYESGWSNRVDVATRRAVLTGSQQMSRQMTDANMEKIIPDKNEQYVEVSAHSGARDKGVGIKNHKSWQGKVYKVQGRTKEYANLKQATGLGGGNGLKGWNCRHSYSPFIPGISERTYTNKELNEIDPKPIGYKGITYTAYEATQKQREIETAIRDTKRQLMGYKEAGLDEAFKQSSIVLQLQKKEYREFSKAAKLKTRDERTQLYGYDKSISQKAVWAEKKSRSE